MKNGKNPRIIKYSNKLDVFELFEKYPQCDRNWIGNTRKLPPIDVVCAFDIETTLVDELDETIMYIWQFAIEQDTCIYGRTWEECKQFFVALNNMLDGTVRRLIVWVHNLSYEFQFLRTVLDFDDVFCIKPRKIAKAVFDRITFQCSYLHSNMNLELFLDKMQVNHKKLELDYDKKRYPWSEISNSELEYCVHDVIGLCEALRKEMELEKDDPDTTPLTSTGYVRRDTKRFVSKKVRNRCQNELVPNEELYVLLREAFRGGNTHANRYYAGRILKNVGSFDRASSYPDVILNCQYPVRKFIKYANINMDFVKKKIKDGYAVVARFSFSNIRLRNQQWGCPYISLSKALEIREPELDNGRILEAEKVTLTLTDIDLKIVEEEYVFDKIEVQEVWTAGYGELPESFKEVNRYYFKMKTELKGNKELEVFYNKNKNKLNSIYGMCAQNPVKDKIKVKGLEYITEHVDIKEGLDDYYKNNFLPYQWGVWVAAWARYRLEEGIKLAGDSFVYCDTDSVKYLKNESNRNLFDSYNKERIKDSIESSAFATANNKIYYMGIYEHDADYDSFITFGAKKYCYEKNGKIAITVSGVSKKYSTEELMELGGLKAFKPGTVFHKAGGVLLEYKDHPARYVILDGKEIMLTSNVNIKPSTYKLNITSEYDRLIQWSDFLENEWGIDYD